MCSGTLEDHDGADQTRASAPGSFSKSGDLHLAFAFQFLEEPVVSRLPDLARQAHNSHLTQQTGYQLTGARIYRKPEEVYRPIALVKTALRASDWPGTSHRGVPRSDR